MNRVDEYLIKASEIGASDLHLTVAVPPMVRFNGTLMPLEGCDPLTPDDTRDIVAQMADERKKKTFEEKGQTDFSYVINGVGRFRVNIFMQRGSCTAAIRLLSRGIPTIDGLGLPDILKALALKQRGLVLVTGPTGSGKSTTLAAMIDYINNNRRCHVLTIEDPIEYLHRHALSLINQREVGADTADFPSALRAALREDPDVIMVGEMRDMETISTALSAAETGHLVFSTLHTVGSAQTVDRIIDMFPPHQQEQVRVQLAAVLVAVITQQLISDTGRKTRVPALEIMPVNDAIRNMIRENKCHQIANVMQTGLKQGMILMDYDLGRLVKSGVIDAQEAYAHCMDQSTLKRYLDFV